MPKEVPMTRLLVIVSSLLLLVFAAPLMAEDDFKPDPTKVEWFKGLDSTVFTEDSLELYNLVKELLSQSDAALNELETARSDLKTRTDELETARSDLKTRTDELATAHSDLETRTDELGTARSDLETTRTDLRTALTKLAKYSSGMNMHSLSALLGGKATAADQSAVKPLNMYSLSQSFSDQRTIKAPGTSGFNMLDLAQKLYTTQ